MYKARNFHAFLHCFCEGTEQIQKRYVWIYALKEPVIPGDILLVKTKRGTDFICVESINYAAGEEFCSIYKKVEKHLHVHMDEGDTNYGK